jgi:hypothetical protein
MKGLDDDGDQPTNSRMTENPLTSEQLSVIQGRPLPVITCRGYSSGCQSISIHISTHMSK